MVTESSFLTIGLVGEMINEDPDLLRQFSVEMEPEDGCVTIYTKNDESIIAFSDFGIETLVNLLEEIWSQPGRLGSIRRPRNLTESPIRAENPASRRPLSAGYNALASLLLDHNDKKVP